MKLEAIDPDITRASTLPADFYRTSEAYDAQRERVFARCWQLYGVDVPGQSSVIPHSLLPGLLDEPLLDTKDAEGRRHLLSNVCTHRGALLVSQPCDKPLLRCPYHGRRFRLDGALDHAPEFQDARDFPTASDNLREIPHDHVGPLRFASLDPRRSFQDWSAPLRRLLAGIPLAQAVLGEPRCYLVDAHWALYCDNYLEGLHIPYVHPGLGREVDLASYTTQVFAGGTVQVAACRSQTAPTLQLAPEHPFFGSRLAALYVYLFPSTLLNVYPWGISVNVIEPIAKDQTRVRYYTLVTHPEHLGVGAGGDLDSVEREDQQVVSLVQRGIVSRSYRRGRYSPTQEVGVHHFHRWLVEQIND